MITVFVFVWAAEAAWYSPIGIQYRWAALMARATAKVLVVFTPILLFSVMFGALSYLKKYFLHTGKCRVLIPCDFYLY